MNSYVLTKYVLTLVIYWILCLGEITYDFIKYFYRSMWSLLIIIIVDRWPRWNIYIVHSMNNIYCVFYWLCFILIITHAITHPYVCHNMCTHTSINIWCSGVYGFLVISVCNDILRWVLCCQHDITTCSLYVDSMCQGITNLSLNQNLSRWFQLPLLNVQNSCIYDDMSSSCH